MDNKSTSFYMPAEWQEHRGMLMQWPVTDQVWGNGLAATRKAFAEVARAISRFERVVMVADPSLTEQARELCGGGDIDVIPLPLDDCWARDNGPTFVVDGAGGLCAIHWQFNAWGNSFPNFEKDNAIPAQLCALWNIPLVEAPIVLEGGSIHTDGAGTLLTTEECLLNSNRNPTRSKGEIEETLLRFLGAEKVIWLPYGLYADETSGHVDNLCCFLEKGTVLLLWTDDIAHPNYDRVRAAQRILKGNGLSIEKITQPPARLLAGKLLPLSYVNFVFTNGGIVMPGFGDNAERTDWEAKMLLRRLFPKREIEQMPSFDIIKGGGNIHCITQQIPV